MTFTEGLAEACLSGNVRPVMYFRTSRITLRTVCSFFLRSYVFVHKRKLILRKQNLLVLRFAGRVFPETWFNFSFSFNQFFFISLSQITVEINFIIKFCNNLKFCVFEYLRFNICIYYFFLIFIFRLFLQEQPTLLRLEYSRYGSVYFSSVI